jgi:two-component system sensor histidine kinase ChiS
MSDIAHVYGTMAEAYAALNDYHNAYDHLYRYAEISDSVSKADFNNYIAKLDKQYQSEKKQETIQRQELELQKQKSSKLMLVLIFTVVLFVGVALFVYLTFKRSVQKRVEEAKGKFFANVAHEIRTPLSMIQAPVKALQGKVTDPDLRYHLDMAERNTVRLNELINQMLDLSKMEAAQYTLSESVGNIGEFVEQVAGRYEAAAKEKHIRFTSEVGRYAVPVLFDKDAVEKIVGNLLSNAIKYTPDGGAAGVDVGMIRKGSSMALQVCVWDTGCGIARENQQKIFDRFYREKHGGDTQGVGIGLSLVKDLVMLMNGSIDVESEPGKGAVFTVLLPVKDQRTSAEVHESEEGNTILLVEDDSDILDFNRRMLSENGYRVVTARDGMEAGSMLNDLLPDLVVTDVMMPRKDGLALLNEIKANPLTEHIPVVILSAKASIDAKIQGVREGAQAYLPKPFHPDELMGVVRNQLLILEKQRDTFRQQAADATQQPEVRFAGTDPFTQKCYSLIAEHMDDAQLSVEKLAELMSTSRSHFQRKLKTLTGYSPSELIRIVRLEKAMELLQKREGNITEVAYLAGFTSQSYFTKCFSEHFGYPPSQVNRPQTV